MAIFGRSKKSKQATAAGPPVPQYEYPTSHWNDTAMQPQLLQLQGYGAQPCSGWPGSHPQLYQQVVVTNYSLPPPPLPVRRTENEGKRARFKSASVANLPKILSADIPSCVPGAYIFNDGVPAWHRQGTEYLNQGAALYDLISSKFDAVVTSIDGGRFSGDERELWVYQPPPPQWQPLPAENPAMANVQPHKKVRPKGVSSNDAECSIAAALTSKNYFSKVDLYANSRLPLNLPQVKLYIPTFPLLCLAAQYSERVYNKPTGEEREAHVESDWRMGTKAMVIKSVPMDHINVIVFAIRGSQTFLDWAVNLNSTPSSPGGFLDDPGNFCHAGFLSVARKMIKPVASRLRHLLEEDPSRSKCSLLITGHSAGGAIAALLYSHMLSTTAETESELKSLAGCFKRVHCITFGSPPVSLLPLSKPPNSEYRKSLFLSFINEGDPVARADKAYVKSLLDLFSHPAPTQTNSSATKFSKKLPFLGGHGTNSSSLVLQKARPLAPQHVNSAPSGPAPVWHIPPSTLSNAGRLILLRSVQRPNASGGRINDRMDDGVQARSITDEQLRGVIWGDPVCHMMKLYARRIEVLATNAVIGRA